MSIISVLGFLLLSSFPNHKTFKTVCQLRDTGGTVGIPGVLNLPVIPGILNSWN